MNNAPNLIEVRRNTNTTRNVLFLGLVVALVGWYGFRFVDETEAQGVFADSGAQKRGGDIQVSFEEHTIVEPVQVTTTTFNSDIYSAHSFLVKDVATGKSLVSSNEYRERPIASITKLMSALVLLDANIDLSGNAVAASGNVFDTFLIPGLQYSNDDLWNAALVGSSNRSILSLVDSLGITREEFVNRMNEKARELGMSDTHFTEPTGLDDTDISSASDVLILLKEALSKPNIYQALSRPEYDIATIENEHDKNIKNTNWLLLNWIPHTFSGLHPGKTGYIPASGYNFTTRIANEEGNEIDIVILGAASHEQRFSEARDIAEWIFSNYDWQSRTIRVPKPIQ